MRIILNLLSYLKKSKIMKKLNKYIKISTLFSILEWLISYLPYNWIFKIIFWSLRVLIFIVGASTVYITTVIGDPSIPLNLYNEIYTKYYNDLYLVSQNVLRKIYNYIKEYLDETVTSDPIKNVNIPEPKLESYFSVNGHKIEIPING